MTRGPGLWMIAAALAAITALSFPKPQVMLAPGPTGPARAAIAQDCQACHAVKRFDSQTCYGCHEHEPTQTLALHREEVMGGNVSNCARCHCSAKGKPGEGGWGRERGGDDARS